VDDEGRYWWYHKSEAFPERRYLRNGPFKSREEAEEHHKPDHAAHPRWFWPSEEEAVSRFDMELRRRLASGER